jgi:site-specific DNA-adenine methylase
MRLKNLNDRNLGSKGASGAYQQIISRMPPHDLYIEPFLGTGVIMQRKPPCLHSVGLDLNTDSLDRARGLLPGTELIRGDGIEFIAGFDYQDYKEPFIYADPPYLETTRSSRNRYTYDFSEADHIRLLDTLRALVAKGVNIMLSGYPNELYDTSLPEWNTREFRVMTRGGVRTEKLWLSYSPDASHWSAFAGKNYIDRQRIQRKAERWAKKFSNLPAAERQAILAAMLDSD